MGARIAMNRLEVMERSCRVDAPERGWLHHREIPASGWRQQPAAMWPGSGALSTERAMRGAQGTSAMLIRAITQ
jgi:hypothetical protein